LALVVVAPAQAHAGRTFYGWLYGTDVMPERGAEIHTWISDESDLKDEGHADETQWLIQPTIGITDQVELLLPVDFVWSKVPGAMPSARTALFSYGAEVRYRMVSSDPVDAPPLVPLLRVAVKRIIVERDTVQPEADLVVAYQQDRINATADLGFQGDVSQNTQHFELHPGAGVSIETLPQLRFGAEVFAEIMLDDNAGSTWATVGPNMAWSHGRSWISAAFGVGVYNIKDSGRLQWGIAF
jgi:hypothetical protein